MTSRLRNEEGQAAVLTVVFILVLVGLAGFVLDVGSWFRQQRQQQSTVDAAALAGAQALPLDPASATSIATDYANKNGGIAGATISITSKYAPNDTITVKKTSSAPGLISSLFGVSTVAISTKATAMVELPTDVFGAAPIVVDIHHPMLSGAGCGSTTPCFGQTTTIPLGKKGVPGAFGLLDFDNSNGTTGNSTLSSWITQGYQHQLPLGNYNSAPGADFNTSQVQGALTGRFGTDLLFPVYDSLTDQGANAPYHIIAWVAFHITGTNAQGTGGSITGYFKRIIWDGLEAPSGPPSNSPDLGVRTVALVD
jgi:Flp pilus assembly protein TadG